MTFLSLCSNKPALLQPLIHYPACTGYPSYTKCIVYQQQYLSSISEARAPMRCYKAAATFHCWRAFFFATFMEQVQNNSPMQIATMKR
jgi:hypothetical protein